MQYEKLLEEDIKFFILYSICFLQTMDKFKKYANENGIKFIGDLPIYVAMDSVDVWASRKTFCWMKIIFRLKIVESASDYFSKAKGQLWGNPLYNWEDMKNDGYGWWLRRIDGANKII